MEEQLSLADMQQQELMKSLSWKLDEQLWTSDVRELGEKYLQSFDANIQAWNKLSKELAQYQLRIEWLKNLAIHSAGDWYEAFIELLKDQEISAVDPLLLTMSNSRESIQYIEQNWFPANKTSINLFNEKFWTNLLSSIELDKKALNSDEACTERLIGLYNQLDHSGLAGTKILALLGKLKEGDTQTYTEIKELLLNEPNELQKLLLSAKKADSINPQSHIYREITLTLIDIDPSFGDKIRAFEDKYSSNKSLETSYLLSLSGSNIEREWDSLISRGDENEIIAIDMWVNPPFREISLDGEYAIESNFPLADLFKPEQEYQKAYKDTMPKIRAAGFLKTQAVQEHIEDLMLYSSDLAQIKSALKRCYQIDVSFVESMDDLKPNNLDNFMMKFQSTLDAAMEKYKTWLDVAIQANREKVKEQDKHKKAILRFVHWIGFDLIDQYFTNSLIQEIKSNSFDVHGLHLDPNRLDIANGMFGESPSEADGTRWKQNLIMFYNKMITWNPDEPLSVAAHISMWWKVEDRTQMQYLLKSHGLLTESGSFNKDKARMNLASSNNI